MTLSFRADRMVEIPVPDEPAIFTGYFVLRLDTAWSVVRSFARAGACAEPGEWVVL
ncbi:hypothetical protein OG885_17440 [Streptomyces sp. NBC_00028]|uniref:hypothetical protein n=1 Tax=Streptomyces sp. NBC_00028 TaxID=2975624 RepID=UPI00324A8298